MKTLTPTRNQSAAQHQKLRSDVVATWKRYLAASQESRPAAYSLHVAAQHAFLQSQLTGGRA